MAAIVVHRYKLKDDVRQSLYDACDEWTSALHKSGQKFMGGDCPNLADLVSRLAALCVWSHSVWSQYRFKQGVALTGRDTTGPPCSRGAIRLEAV